MTPKRKRTPEEIFDILEQQAAEDEARRILALSDEDLDRELYDLGFDPAAERAWGRALGERAMRQARQVRRAGEVAVARKPTLGGVTLVPLPYAPGDTPLHSQ